MQEALPYKAWQPEAATPPSSNGGVARESVGRAVKESAVIVVATRGCCMGHVVRRLLLSLGVNPALYEVEEGEEEAVAAEMRAVGEVELPAVFIGGRLFGGLDRVMAAHITGDLNPVLKKAGALWL